MSGITRVLLERAFCDDVGMVEAGVRLYTPALNPLNMQKYRGPGCGTQADGKPVGQFSVGGEFPVGHVMSFPSPLEAGVGVKVCAFFQLTMLNCFSPQRNNVFETV